MITLSPLKALTLTRPAQANRHAHLSAASGLVQVGKWLYVVADDENHLGVFPFDSVNKGTLKELFPGELPLLYEERKAEKPDLEVLTLIPPSAHHAHGALLALSSGSKKLRTKGIIISFNKSGELQDDVEIIDLTNLYDEIKKDIGKLNIEGAVIIDKDIILFQRGNKKNKINATIQIPINQFFNYINPSEKKLTHNLEVNITHYDLGDIDGVPLCFTDATVLENSDIVFCAAAENTSDSYLDGTCMGSAIGIIKINSELYKIEQVDQIIKIEGIEAKIVDNHIELLLVTDADDENIPAQLYSAILHTYPM